MKTTVRSHYRKGCAKPVRMHSRRFKARVKIPGVKPTIGTMAGEARYIGTEVEDDKGRFNDSYETKDGYWLTHEGDKHHVYMVDDDHERKRIKNTLALAEKYALEEEKSRMRAKKKPYFVPEPYGLPFELQSAGKFRPLKKQRMKARESPDDDYGLKADEVDGILKKYPAAKKIAVENFLMTKSGDELADNMNMSMDADMYKWNRDTRNAIREGIRMKRKSGGGGL